jgi:hypothetical protein
VNDIDNYDQKITLWEYVAARKIAQEITLQKRGRRVKNLVVVLN